MTRVIVPKVKLLCFVVLLVLIQCTKQTNPEAPQCTLPERDDTGIRFVMMLETANILWQDVYIPELNSMTFDILIPDVADVVTTPVGKIEYTVTNMEISQPIISGDNVTLHPNDSTVRVTAYLGITFSFDFSFRQLSFPYLRDKGNGVAIVEKAKTSVSARVKRAPDGLVMVEVDDFVFDLANLMINIDSTYDWLYDIIIAVFMEDVTEMLSAEITARVLALLEEQMAGLYKNFSLCGSEIPGILFDTRMTTPLLDITPTYMAIGFPFLPVNGADECLCELFEDIPRSPKVPINDIMGPYHTQALISVWTIERNMAAMSVDGHLVTPVVEHDGTTLFQTPTWEDAVPGITDAFPGVSEWHFRASFVENDDYGKIQIATHSGALLMKSPMLLEFLDAATGEHKLTVLTASEWVLTPCKATVEDVNLAFTFEFYRVRLQRVVYDASNSALAVGSTYDDATEEICEYYLPEALNAMLPLGVLPILTMKNAVGTQITYSSFMIDPMTQAVAYVENIAPAMANA